MAITVADLDTKYCMHCNRDLRDHCHEDEGAWYDSSRGCGVTTAINCNRLNCDIPSRQRYNSPCWQVILRKRSQLRLTMFGRCLQQLRRFG